MKFSEYPLNIPDKDKIIKKINAITESFKNAESVEEANKAMKKMNRLMVNLSTDVTTISVRFL